MQVTVEIPDDLASDLEAGFPSLGQAALEALAAEAYEREVFSLEQVRMMLGPGSPAEARDVLRRHGVWPGLSSEEVVEDADNVAAVKPAVGAAEWARKARGIARREAGETAEEARYRSLSGRFGA